MKRIEKSRPSRLSALIVSVLIVGLIFGAIVHRADIARIIDEYDLDLGRLGFLLGDPPADGELELHFIDVGQGDAILLMTDETSVLIDCGTDDSERRLAAYLRTAGVKTLDLLILTHPHSDHIGGAELIVERFEVGGILMPFPDESSLYLDRLLESAEKNEVEITLAEQSNGFVPGARLTVGELGFTLLAPSANASGNDLSLVLRLEFGECSFLFSADAEADSEENMLALFGDSLDSDLLKLGHHGSNTSSCEEFLEAVTPEWAIVSCGRDNPYGHPHREVLTRLDDLGVDEKNILRTDREGSIILSCDGESIEKK